MDYGNDNATRFHWEPTVIIITALVFLVLLGTVVGITYPLWSIKVVIVGIVIFSPLLVTFLYCPTHLCFNNKTLIIKRIKGAIKIPVTEIKTVAPIKKSEITSSIRIFGSGGLFGYLGIFKNRRMGKFYMYATELSDLYVIKTHNKTYVICCRNRMLIQALKQQLS